MLHKPGSIVGAAALLAHSPASNHALRATQQLTSLSASLCLCRHGVMVPLGLPLATVQARG